MRTANDFYTYGNGRIQMALDNRTNGLVAAALYSAYQTGRRVRIWYGDIETGRSWNEELDVTGRVATSMGPRHIPILLNNSRSTGGGGILDHCIVKVQETKSKRVLYEHPTFSWGMFLAGPPHGGGLAPPVDGLPPEYTASVWHRFNDTDWANVANFRNLDAAKRYVAFMRGERFTTGGRI
jgi:hypothetical protein